MAHHYRDIVYRAFEDLVAVGNLDRVEDYIARDYVGYFPGYPPVRGIDAFRQMSSMYISAFSNRRYNIDDVVVEGEKVVVRATVYGTHTGEYMGIAPTGKEVSVAMVSIFRFAGDKIAEEWGVCDDFGLFQQLGAIPNLRERVAALASR
jgi:predicted ester cyclase